MRTLIDLLGQRDPTPEAHAEVVVALLADLPKD
jgi:hypothetical protein